MINYKKMRCNNKYSYRNSNEKKEIIQEGKNAQEINILEKITWYRNLLRASIVKVNQILCLDFCLASAAIRSSLETSFSKYESGCPTMFWMRKNL